MRVSTSVHQDDFLKMLTSENCQRAALSCSKGKLTVIAGFMVQPAGKHREPNSNPVTEHRAPAACLSVLAVRYCFGKSQATHAWSKTQRSSLPAQ